MRAAQSDQKAAGYSMHERVKYHENEVKLLAAEVMALQKPFATARWVANVSSGPVLCGTFCL